MFIAALVFVGKVLLKLAMAVGLGLLIVMVIVTTD